MVRIINILVIIVVMSSCGVPRYIQQNFTICYNGEDTGIESLLDIHGYYVSLDSSRMRYPPHKPFELNLMFFKDGMFLYNFGGIEPVGHPFIGNQRLIDIPQYFQKIVTDTISTKYGIRKSFSTSFYWGIYKISGDTIIVQQINNPSPPKSWAAYEMYFKIVNRTTITPIAQRGLFDRNNSKVWPYSQEKQQSKTARFVYVDTIPESYSWLKGEKWFWCNEKDWEAYKKQGN